MTDYQFNELVLFNLPLGLISWGKDVHDTWEGINRSEVHNALQSMVDKAPCKG